MKRKNLYRTYALLFALIGLNWIQAKSQMEVFLSVPDTKIQRVVALSNDNGNVEDTARVLEYDKNGLLIQERVPAYYIYIDYRYNKQGQIVEKEALYGESFENGTSSYFYSTDSIIEIIQAMGYFQKNLKTYNKKKQLISETVYFAACGAGESFIEHIIYNYYETGKPNLTEYKRIYYDFSGEPTEFFDMEESQILAELQSASKLREEKKHTIYDYKGNLCQSETTYDSNTRKKLMEITYKYDNDGKILLKKEIAYTYPENKNTKPIPTINVNYSIKYKYNNNGELIEIQQINAGYTHTGYYADGKLLRETEMYDNKDSLPTEIKYQYFYYN